MSNTLAMKALEKVREHNARIAALESELAASRAQVATLREALRNSIPWIGYLCDDSVIVDAARAALAATEDRSEARTAAEPEGGAR